jgi:hypothetical protein
VDVHVSASAGLVTRFYIWPQRPVAVALAKLPFVVVHASVLAALLMLTIHFPSSDDPRKMHLDPQFPFVPYEKVVE